MKFKFTKDELKRIKMLCSMFNAQAVLVDGVKYAPPKVNIKLTGTAGMPLNQAEMPQISTIGINKVESG